MQQALKQLVHLEKGSTPLESTKPKFDRNAAHRDYMRGYMRKRRQKESKSEKGG
jgi:hypothetical protein